MEEKPQMFGSGLVDLTGLTLSDVGELGGSTLAHMLRVVLEEDLAGPVAGFQNSI